MVRTGAIVASVVPGPEIGAESSDQLRSEPEVRLGVTVQVRMRK